MGNASGGSLPSAQQADARNSYITLGAAAIIIGAVLGGFVWIISFVGDKVTEAETRTNIAIESVEKRLVAAIEKHDKSDYHSGMPAYVDGQVATLSGRLQALEASVGSIAVTMGKVEVLLGQALNKQGDKVELRSPPQ